MDETLEYQVPPFFSSLILHALILALLFFLIYREQESGGRKSETIQIETVSKEKTRAKIVPQHLSKSNANRNEVSPTRPHQVSLADLGMRLSTAPAPADSAPETGYSRPPSEAASDDDWDIMNPDPKIARFNQYVYNVVQGWLDRDAYLNPQQIYGTVKVRIWFDENGNYLEDQTGYQAIDPNFQKIVARALKKAFLNPVPRPFLFMHKTFYIDRMVVIRR